MSSTTRRTIVRLLLLLFIALLVWYLLHVLLPGQMGSAPGSTNRLHIRKEGNMMTIDCPFLERLPRPQAGSTHGCAAAVNFYDVGKDRERCRACAIAAMGRVPDCEHLDAFTWLERRPDGTPFVRIELLCDLAEDPLPDLRRCARCPERLAPPVPLAWPAMAAAVARQASVSSSG